MKYGISKYEFQDLLTDKKCGYCQIEMIYPYDRKNRNRSLTIEHLNFDGPFYVRNGLRIEDIILCCGKCNSSRGKKKIKDWFNSNYCINLNIKSETVSDIVKNYLKRNPDK